MPDQAESTQEVPARPGGRSARVRAAVLDATMDLLVACGVEGLRVEDVARRSSVHKTTIYRRWPTKTDLVFDAVQEHTSSAIPMPDTGTVREDFIEIMVSLSRLLKSTVGRAIVRTVTAASPESKDIAALGRATWRRQVEAATVVVERAIQSGELPPIETSRLYEALCGPVHLRSLLGGRQFTRAEATRHVDLVLAGLKATKKGAR